MSAPLIRRRSRQSIDIPFNSAPELIPTSARRFEFSPSLARSPRLDQSELRRKIGEPFAFLNKRLPRNLRIGRNYPTLLYISVVALVWMMGKRFLFGPETLPPPPCFAFDRPGRLLVNLTSPLHTHWRPLDEESCPPLPRYLPDLWKLSKGPSTPFPSARLSDYNEQYRLVQSSPLTRHRKVGLSPDGTEDAVAFLRKPRAGAPPTVLIIGDSVDRNGLVHFCQLLQQPVSIFMYGDIENKVKMGTEDLTINHGPRFNGWDQRGLPHMCEIPLAMEKWMKGKARVALRVINGFHYGMDALDEFDTPDHPDWHKPGRLENRIDELFVPMLEQMGGIEKVDLILLHSGMWDLVRFISFFKSG
ncbi:hypothetical protein P7C70_g5630, partial [Phenoliferia sp. Uapishka_3]